MNRIHILEDDEAEGYGRCISKVCTIELADLRRTLEDFMKKQQQRNDAIKTKLEKKFYSMEKLGVQDDGKIKDKEQITHQLTCCSLLMLPS